MKARRTSTRTLQLGLLVLLVVCAAQVGWWILDQWLYMHELSELTGRLPELEGAIDMDRRMNRYFWEGGFFLVVLLVGMGVLARALTREAQLRYRQQVFLASVSHELRSPLATSRAAAETLLLRDPAPEERGRLVERVLRNLRRLEEMVSNLLDTARIDEGELKLTPEPIEVESALRRIVAEERERLEPAGIAVSIDAPPGLTLLADAEAFRTVMRNLIGNALKALESGAADASGVDPGGEPADGRAPRLRLVAGSVRQGVEIRVIDNGHGFDPEDAERLFERFWRPGDEMRRGGRGAGLGLYIARALAQASGAQLTASSRGLGQGARFDLVWPSPSPEAAAEPEEATPTAGGSGS